MLGILFGLFIIVLVAAIGVAGYFLVLYNSLVQVKNNVDAAWSNIDVLLKQRADELGKLIDAVKAYLHYEQDLLTRLTTLRNQVGQGGSGEDRLKGEQDLGTGLGRLLAVAENYPDLKSSQNFLDLQQRISGLEQQLAHRREFYNDSVNINNVRMEQMPDRLLAARAGLRRRALFEASAQERADVDVTGRLGNLTA
jgi:LemA protein